MQHCDDAGRMVCSARMSGTAATYKRHRREAQKGQNAGRHGRLQNTMPWFASCSMFQDLNIPDPSGLSICCQPGGLGAATAILAMSKRSLSESASMPRYSAISCACMLMHILASVYLCDAATATESEVVWCKQDTLHAYWRRTRHDGMVYQRSTHCLFAWNCKSDSLMAHKDRDTLKHSCAALVKVRPLWLCMVLSLQPWPLLRSLPRP